MRAHARLRFTGTINYASSRYTPVHLYLHGCPLALDAPVWIIPLWCMQIRTPPPSYLKSIFDDGHVKSAVILWNRKSRKLIPPLRSRLWVINESRRMVDKNVKKILIEILPCHLIYLFHYFRFNFVMFRADSSKYIFIHLLIQCFAILLKRRSMIS